VAAAVKNDVQGVAGGVSRPLAAGSEIFAEELVKTGDASNAQLIFLDETSLSIGPKSEITLDRFVFDPTRETGNVVLPASRGAFRIIIGSQDPKSYTLRTPVAMIGVRGTILDCFVTDEGIVICAVDEGSAVLVIDGVSYVVASGQIIYVDKNHQVHGPMTPDGKFFKIFNGVPWPLYGGIPPAATSAMKSRTAQRFVWTSPRRTTSIFARIAIRTRNAARSDRFAVALNA
jgi:hypothetical protein